MDGWIKLYRKFINWQWYGVINVRITFLHLLLMANHEDSFVYGVKVKRGQFLTSYDRLANAVGITNKQIRNALEKLKNTNEIGVKRAGNFTIITICNYDSYQCFEDEGGQTKGNQRADRGQTEGRQRATNNNDKNDNNDKNIIYSCESELSPPNKKKTKEERKKEFAERLAEYKDQYTHEMLLAFYEYWTESNEGENTKMRFEKEKTYELSKRLKTWFNRQNGKQYGTDGKGQNAKGRFEVGINPVSEYERDF